MTKLNVKNCVSRILVWFLSTKIINEKEKNPLGIQLEKLFDEQKNSDLEMDVETEFGETEVLKLHKAVLVARSPFFDRMIRGNFKEHSSSTLHHITRFPLSSFKVFLR